MAIRRKHLNQLPQSDTHLLFYTEILKSKTSRTTVSLFFLCFFTRPSTNPLPSDSRDFIPSSEALGSSGPPPLFRSSELGARAAHVESITRLDQYSPIIRSSLLPRYFRLLPNPHPCFPSRCCGEVYMSAAVHCPNPCNVEMNVGIPRMFYNLFVQPRMPGTGLFGSNREI